MEEGFTDRIRKSVLTAEHLLSEAENLADRSNILSAEERELLPKFKGLWKEKEIRKYLDQLEEALKKPCVYRSRKLLEEVGITSESISSDVLESTEEIKKLVSKLIQLNDISGLLQALEDTRIVSHWLNDDSIVAIEKVDAIVEAKEAFRRLTDLDNLEDTIKSSFIKSAFEDLSSIQQAEELDSRIASLRSYGIDCNATEVDLQPLLELCGQVHQTISDLESLYKATTDEIKASVRGKPLAEAHKVITDKLSKTRQQYSNLEIEWLGLSRTLKSLGYDIPPKPKGIFEMQTSISELENKCQESLGESGQKLLNFLVGKSGFPEELSGEEIKSALEKLRPFIIKGLGGMEWPE